MCLAALALQRSTRFPLVLIANRDEFHDRPSAPLDWWPTSTEGVQVLGGRDLQAGGTWFGLNAVGRWGLLTNIRSTAPVSPQAPSRGRLVADWLGGHGPIDRFWMRAGVSGYNGFNLIAARWSADAELPWECHWFSSASAMPRRLMRGVWGLSNGTLDEPWPKVVGLKAALLRCLATHRRVDALIAGLLEVLRSREQPADDRLPATGVPLDIERGLAPVFVHMPERGYGTRSSHLLIGERGGSGALRLHVVEQSYDAAGEPRGLRQVCLSDWPLVSGRTLPPTWAVR